MNETDNLTNLQIELLKIFSYELPEEQLEEIREILSKYFAEKASDEMDKLWEKRNWSNEKMEEILKEHLRTKYD